jgi:hypothetical protein
VTIGDGGFVTISAREEKEREGEERCTSLILGFNLILVIGFFLIRIGLDGFYLIFTWVCHVRS